MTELLVAELNELVPVLSELTELLVAELNEFTWLTVAVVELLSRVLREETAELATVERLTIFCQDRRFGGLRLGFLEGRRRRLAIILIV